MPRINTFGCNVKIYIQLDRFNRQDDVLSRVESLSSCVALLRCLLRALHESYEPLLMNPSSIAKMQVGDEAQFLPTTWAVSAQILSDILCALFRVLSHPGTWSTTQMNLIRTEVASTLDSYRLNVVIVQARDCVIPMVDPPL